VMLSAEGLRKVAYSLNQVTDVKRETAAIDQVTAIWWKELAGGFDAAIKVDPEQQEVLSTDSEMIGEILESVRAMQRDQVVNDRFLKNPKHSWMLAQDWNNSSVALNEAIGEVLDDVALLGDWGDVRASFSSRSVTIWSEQEVPDPIKNLITKRILLLRPNQEVNFRLKSDEL
jgi:hypothetical protein